MPARERIMSARRCAASAAVVALVGACGMLPPSASASSAVSPALLKRASGGIALIRPTACNGKALPRATGFLVGRSVVMTTRHALVGACTVRVTVGGKTLKSKEWTHWSDKQTSEAATDLATIDLGRPAKGGRILTLGATGARPGATLATAGYPLGTKLRIAQGKVIWRGKVKGAPLIAVRMRATLGADGAPLLDSGGRVVAIVRTVVGSRGVVRPRRAAEVGGLDLARWWGTDAVPDLCDTYPKGGIPNCPVAEPEPEPDPVPAPSAGAGTPDQPDETVPSDPAAPPRSPTDYTIQSCWMQYTGDSWDNVTSANAATTFPASELVAKGPRNFWSIVQLTEGAPAVIKGVTASLVSPGGFVSPGGPFEWIEDGDRASETLAWTLSALGVWFFQNPNYPPPATWRLRWSFPNGQTCDTPFTVT